MIELLAAQLNPYPLVEVEPLELPLFCIEVIELLEDIVFEDSHTGLLEIVNFLVYDELILVDGFVFVFIID